MTYRTAIINDPTLADRIIERLNVLIESNDDVRRDIASLLLMRSQVFEATANHPTLQVGQEHDEMPATLGVLGLLNGLCGIIEGRFTPEEKAMRTSVALDPDANEFEDDHGAVRSIELEGYGFIGAVWEEGQLVRFERTKLAARTPATMPPTANKVQFLVNGRGHEIHLGTAEEGVVGYDKIVEIAGKKAKVVYTVTWKKTDGEGGTLRPGQTVALQMGMTFNVSDTSGA
jgi:hypothetical protein